MESQLHPGADGLYCICIHGISALTDEGIKDIFSKYGEVIKVSRSGNNLGFVRYKEFSEAKAAMDDMESNPYYRVRVAHDKREPHSFSGRPRTDRNNTDTYQKQTVVNGKPSGLRHPRSRTPSVKDELPKEDSTVPPLKFNENVAEGIPAKQLIIANLPHNAIQYQIYELCKPVKVLHVDLFTTYSNITYAHVHVKTNSEVEAIEKQLNGIEVEGEKMVVISAERLLAEYSTPNLAVTSGRK